jgi:hypothetical protein
MPPAYVNLLITAKTLYSLPRHDRVAKLMDAMDFTYLVIGDHDFKYNVLGILRTEIFSDSHDDVEVWGALGGRIWSVWIKDAFDFTSLLRYVSQECRFAFLDAYYLYKKKHP